jgi:hypothetical protein
MKWNLVLLLSRFCRRLLLISPVVVVTVALIYRNWLSCAGKELDRLYISKL